MSKHKNIKIFKTSLKHKNCPIYKNQQTKKKLKFCCYNSHKVSLCGGCKYSLYVDATVVLARYVLMAAWDATIGAAGNQKRM